MSLISVLSFTLKYLLGLSKVKLVKVIDVLRKRYFEIELENKHLKEEIERLKSEQTKQRVQRVNKTVNQPTSKQPEWETKGVGNDGLKKKKGRGRKGRLGAGNNTNTKSPWKRNIHKTIAKIARQVG